MRRRAPQGRFVRQREFPRRAGHVPLRGLAQAAVRHEARQAQQRQVDRARRSTSSPTCRSRAVTGSSSSTTSISRATRSRSRSARRPACRSCRWASTTTPTGSSRPSSPTTTAWPTCCCRRPTASAARRPPASARNLYRYVGNDPGVPGRLNLNYNPSYRTIAAEFEVLPGSARAGRPGADAGGRERPAAGRADDLAGARASSTTRTPELYAVSRPYVTRQRQHCGTAPFTISGKGFGAPATGQVTAGWHCGDLRRSTWSDTQITVSVTRRRPTVRTKATDDHRGQRSEHGQRPDASTCCGGGYNPQLYEVARRVSYEQSDPAGTSQPQETLPAAADHAIQRALDAAAASR